MSCERIELVRDFAFEELDAAGRRSVEQHIAACGECALELQRLQLTAAALRIVPDREIPQRVAFVSDKVFEPSPAVRFFRGIWNSGAKLAFVSACLLAAAIGYSAWHRPLEVRTVVHAANPDVSKQVEEAVNRAVAAVREQDRRAAQLELAAVEKKYDDRQKALMVSVQENFEVMQKRLSSYTMLASADMSRETGQ